MTNRTRIGIGYDVHPLVTGRKLILGGVEIPFNKGLDGWSDADVLVHAIMDALLGAAALGDIGTHFPPGNPEYKNVSSLILLSKVKKLLDENRWRIGNVDVMILAEEPKLKDYMDAMTRNIASILDLSPADVSIKAGTNEKMGFIGRGEGIAVEAIALLESIQDA
ncbi:MAG: 2-C-methyl-D-erythritol 2,4-cyclodiphosphate synthase [Dehalococcoidales bacterium]|jgi:2-C-methyl-D-erythritol 2,4-cyclodiphosphate synthase|nr:2-C-methyl-D-erythritol 2,4-cyclodiphosphate synthase [Dehalococcoidales bacterium]